ncbi:MAG TPA: hypothetical protein VFS20_22895 [Longimicrobium sp.]|nr:hypothetical protein [Longimicrobium sp.]
MSRNLLPPLKQGNNVAVADPPGAWSPFEQAWTLAKHVALPAEDVHRGWSDITSIPSPWARILLFRHALEEGHAHPLFEEVVSDVLDTLELFFFQQHLQGQCFVKPLDLAQLDRDFPGADRAFRRALVSQAPRVPEGDGSAETRMTSVGLVYYGHSPDTARAIALTSPFTLFVTPADKTEEIEGYYEFAVKPHAHFRGVRDRDPLFVRYVREHLLPQVRSRPAMQGLSRYLDGELAGARVEAGELEIEPVETLPGAGGVVLHKASVLRIRSPLSLRSSRVEPGAAPLVLTPNLPQTVYYNQVPLPRPWVLDPDAPREQLPATHIRHPWVHPAEDFLEPVLLQMPAELQGVLRDRKNSAETARYLLPLKPKFFEYFSPDEVSGIVSISSNPYGVVSVQLDIPVVGGHGVGQTLTVQRTYKPREESRSLERTFLSLWPNFEAAAWKDYYLLHFEYGGEASAAGRVEFYSDHGRIHPQAQRQQNGALGEGVDRVEREPSTAVYHTTAAPHVIRFVREDGLAGVLLPRLVNRKGAFQEQTSWQVGIDFGTSNTIVALKQTGQGNAPEVIRLGEATRISFCGTVQPSVAAVWEDTLNYYFFPREVSPAPFASQVFWRTDARRDVPGIHANIPFSGELSAHGSNVLLTNLKWSDDSHANHLTKLFLQQVSMMVSAEAIARAIPPESIEYSWSFPMAFTENKVNLFTGMWRAVLGRTVRSRDESTCALLFFRDGSHDFTPDATAAKVTVDVGGGTSDIACYAKGRALFRDSILFGGQELTGSSQTEGEKRVFNPFVQKLISYADAHGFNQSQVLARYNSSHSKFSYLVKTEWFARHHSDIAAQAWFEQFQCAVFYFYATLLYYVGLRLRTEKLTPDQHPNIVFFGGNGSRFLDWLVAFSDWTSAQKGQYLRAFSAILHAGLAPTAEKAAAEPPRLDVRASASPKHEVAVGLLLDPAGLKIEQSHTGAALGEVVKVGEGGTLAAEASTRDASIAQEGAKDLKFTAPFAEREIVRLNRVFVQQLKELGFNHATVQRARAQFEELDETFFGDAVAARLGSYFHAEGDQVFNGSILTLEAASCLQRLL